MLFSRLAAIFRWVTCPSAFFLPYPSPEAKLLRVRSVFFWLSGDVNIASVTWKVFASLHFMKNTYFN